jgi:hypothetical protein
MPAKAAAQPHFNITSRLRFKTVRSAQMCSSSSASAPRSKRPRASAHAAGVFFARAEAPAEVDIHHGGFESALPQRHRDRTSDDSAADQHHVVAPHATHRLIV